MPQGKGTYGSKIGRPPQKLKLGGTPRVATARKEKKKDVNTPGEKQREIKGAVDLMVSMSKGDYNKAIKSIRAKRR